MAIDAVSEAMDLYNTAVDHAIPWTKLREIKTKLDQSGSEFSKQSTDWVGRIKTQLLNTIDAYDSVTQSIYEMCGSVTSTLSRYVQLFNVPNPATMTTQKNLLISTLDNGIRHLKQAQKELVHTLSALKTASDEFKSLLSQLKIDYSENSDFFKNRLNKIVAEKSGFWSFFKKKQIEKEAIAELKAKTKPIETFYTDANVIVQQALENLDQTSVKLNENLKTVEQQKTQLSTSNADDASGSRDAIIQSAQALIAKCHEYSQRHA